MSFALTYPNLYDFLFSAFRKLINPDFVIAAFTEDSLKKAEHAAKFLMENNIDFLVSENDDEYEIFKKAPNIKCLEDIIIFTVRVHNFSSK
jgi:hypothetical protein